MSESGFTLVGSVKAIEPRGNPKQAEDGRNVQTYWTVKIDVGTQYPINCSFNSHLKPAEGQQVGAPNEQFKILQEALFSQQRVKIKGWLQDGKNQAGQPVTYKNGNHAELASADDATGLVDHATRDAQSSDTQNAATQAPSATAQNAAPERSQSVSQRSSSTLDEVYRALEIVIANIPENMQATQGFDEQGRPTLDDGNFEIRTNYVRGKVMGVVKLARSLAATLDSDNPPTPEGRT